MTTTPSTPGARRVAIASATALVAFLAMDACWLTFMGPRLYRPALGAMMAEQVDGLAVVLFYAVYIAGLVGFAVMPALETGQAPRALRRGAAFGLVAYATYDLTNQATLRGWPWSITCADLAWGLFASAVAAWVATRLTSRLAR